MKISSSRVMNKLAKICSTFIDQLKYYKYEPDKPSKSDFLSWSVIKQEEWIEEHYPNFVENLYGSNYLGSSYQLPQSKLDEYLDAPEDYGISAMIAAQLEDISEERQEQIDAGVSLTDTETTALQKAIAEYDYDGWDIHSGQFIKVRFGAVYGLYVGQDIGQGGVDFELEEMFKTKRAALNYLAQKEMIALEWEYFSVLNS